MKKLLLAILMLTILLSFTTCKFFDSIFFVAQSVSPKDLADYTGTPPTSRLDAMMSMADPGYIAFYALMSDMSKRPEFTEFGNSMSKVLLGNTPTGKLIQKALMSKIGKSISISQSGLNSSAISTDGTKEFHVDIENETVNNSSVDTTAMGTLTINKCKLDLVGTSTGASTQHPPTSIDVTQAEADISLSADNYKIGAYDPNITLNSARIGLKVKGTGNMTFSATPYSPTSETYDLSLSLKAGLSFSNANPGAFSGKYIIELSYYDSGELTEADFSGSDPYAAINKIKFELSIKLYDNNDDLVNEWTFDQSDLVDALKNGFKG